MSNYPEVVKQIHDEFNIAGERLLQESIELINQSEKVDIDKAKKLNELGFLNNPQLKRALQIEEETRMPATLAKTIQEYTNKYRGYKFISTEDVDKINKKYNLVLSGVESYIGFVPAKNLAEVELFKRKFYLINRYKIKSMTYRRYNMNYFLPDFSSNKIKPIIEAYLKKVNSIIQSEDDWSVKMELNKVVKNIKPNFIIGKVEVEKLSPFVICAPKTDILETKNETSLKFETVPDPIVLYPVDMGYIIVTAWGDEASDELVVNQNNN